MFYQLRRYTPKAGKSEALHARFRDHVLHLLAKAEVEVLGFFEESDGKVTYLVRFADQEAARAAWERFNQSPQWQQVKGVTEADGPLTESIESLDLSPLPYFKGLLR